MRVLNPKFGDSERTQAFQKVAKMAQDLVPIPQLGSAPTKYFHHGRSFYSEEQWQRLNADLAQQADSKAKAVPTGQADSPAMVQKEHERSAEEARLVTYVVNALQDLYSADFSTESVALDVHSQRPGSQYENIDVLACHWIQQDLVELVTVEVKLSFTATAVYQARNYQSFSDRAWVAVVVTADAANAGAELRENNYSLFEQATDAGIGILGCRMRQGRAYDVFPIHWPKLNKITRYERTNFLQRYQANFSACGVPTPGLTRVANFQG